MYRKEERIVELVVDAARDARIREIEAVARALRWVLALAHDTIAEVDHPEANDCGPAPHYFETKIIQRLSALTTVRITENAGLTPFPFPFRYGPTTETDHA